MPVDAVRRGEDPFVTRFRRPIPVLLGLAAALGLWTVLAGMPAASAHSVLIATSPKDGSTVTTPPTRVVLTFNEAVSKDFSQIRVSDAAGHPVTVGGTVISGAVVSQALRPDLPPGRYTVVFKVVSADGHPVSQQMTFTIAAAASPTSTPASSPASAPSSPATGSATPLASATAGATAASSRTSDGSPLPWVLGGLGVLAVVAGGGLAWRRSRSPAH